MKQISVWVKSLNNNSYTPIQVVSVPKIGEKMILVEKKQTVSKMLQVVDVVHTAIAEDVGGEPTIDVYVKEIKH